MNRGIVNIEVSGVNSLEIFNSPEFGQVRGFLRDGEPWFVAGDVATALGYSNPSEAIRDNCKYAELLKDSQQLGLGIGPRGVLIIPEADLYALIFRSKLEKAERFRDWVCKEVLPTIRKTGGYGHFVPQTFAEALRTYADEVEKREQAEIIARGALSRAQAAEECIGIAEQWRQIKAMDWVCSVFNTHGKVNPVWSQLGHLASRITKNLGYERKLSLDPEWGSVWVYHIDVLKATHTYIINHPEWMAAYRK